jgi:PAS domain S-box-containing protein
LGSDEVEAKRAHELRTRAEKVAASEDKNAASLSPQEIREVVHELRTHQIEMEMQNEELRTAQQKLIEARDRYSNLYDFAPVGYATLSDKGLILEANLTLSDMLRVERSQLLQQRLSSYILPDDQDAYYRHIQALKATGQRRTCEIRMRGKDDCRELWVRTEWVPVAAPDEGLRFRAAFFDVTEWRRTEQVRLDLERQVQHAQKLESLGVLAGGIAHDFNNLLMVILGNADLAMRSPSLAAPQQQFLAEIKGAAERAAELSNQMLAYAGKGHFVVEPIDLNGFVEEMGHLLHVSVSKKAVQRIELAGDLPSIDADAAQIRQVLMNLITNASEAIGEEEGVITIATGVVDADAALLSAGLGGEDLLEGRYVSLEVSDTGCGMDGDTQAKLFDPFFSTKFTGRGLGLAAVLGIMRSHNGAIYVRSELGKGTTFKLLIPCCAEALQEADRSGVGAEAEIWRPDVGTVLLVDDEDGVRKIVQRMLEGEGFRVIGAADGREAVDAFHEHADEIGIVLLDMKMPRLNGEEAFRELRQIRPDLRVILCSGYTQEDATSRFAGLGLAGFIQKPYGHDTLMAKLREVVRRR